MKRRMGSALPLALAAILLWSTASVAQASDNYGPQGGTSTTALSAPPAAAMVFDLVVVRPLGLVATLLGTGVFILNLPLTPFEKDAPQAPFQRLMADPARYTFSRPLGEM